MKELDVLLERFARERYPSASAERKRAFERLLELPDPVVVELLLAAAGTVGGAPTGTPAAEPIPVGAGSPPAPEDEDLADVVALIAGRR